MSILQVSRCCKRDGGQVEDDVGGDVGVLSPGGSRSAVFLAVSTTSPFGLGLEISSLPYSEYMFLYEIEASDLTGYSLYHHRCFFKMGSITKISSFVCTLAL